MKKFVGSTLSEFKKQLRNFEAENWQKFKKPQPQPLGLVSYKTNKVYN